MNDTSSTDLPEPLGSPPHGSTSANKAGENSAPTLSRSTVRLERETFLAIFTLTQSQPWLKEKQVALCELIDDCKDHCQQLLLFKLLQRFTFINGITFQASIQLMVDFIEVKLGLSGTNCAIAASENGKYADSSQLVLYQLKSAKWRSIDWSTTSFVASLAGLVDSADKVNLVVVDEFVGTGETAEKKIKWIREKLKEKGHSPKIYFAAIAGMESGISRIRNSVDDIFVAHTLRKGISDFSLPAELQTDLGHMKKLEDGLSVEGRRGKLKKHSLGYKASESLYVRANGNTPNNVFPIFWWEAKLNGSLRQTLLSCI